MSKGLGTRQQRLFTILQNVYSRQPGLWGRERSLIEKPEKPSGYEVDRRAIRTLHQRQLIERGTAVLDRTRFAVCRLKPPSTTLDILNELIRRLHHSRNQINELLQQTGGNERIFIDKIITTSDIIDHHDHTVTQATVTTISP